MHVLCPGLAARKYHVQVSRDGFKTIIKADVILNVQSAVALNFELPVGSTSESITVDAVSIGINVTDASVSTVIDRKFVENMPLNGRSFQDLISMTPGVVSQSPQASQAVGASGDFSVNGQRAESNYYTVDGAQREHWGWCCHGWSSGRDERLYWCDDRSRNHAEPYLRGRIAGVPGIEFDLLGGVRS